MIGERRMTLIEKAEDEVLFMHLVINPNLRIIHKYKKRMRPLNDPKTS